MCLLSSYPQLVSNMDPAGCNDAMPKSAILMLLLRSRSRFSGFKSRWLCSIIMSMYVFVGWCHGYYIPNEVMMAIVKAHNDVLEMTAGFIFTKTTLAHQVFEKLATFDILENQVPVSMTTTVSAFHFLSRRSSGAKREEWIKERKKSAITRPMRSVWEEHRYKGEEERNPESETYKSGEFSSSITSIRPMTLGCVISFMRAISRRTAFSMAGLAAR